MLSEKPPHQTPQIPKPPKSKDNSSVASQQADYVSMQGGVRGPKEEIFLKKIHIKRRCSRSSDASSTASASEDWTIDFTQAAESSTTSMSGTQDDRSVEESKVSIVSKIFSFRFYILLCLVNCKFVPGDAVYYHITSRSKHLFVQKRNN